MRSEDRGLQPRKQPRQARAELTRQRILTAAAHVFAEYGYAAGTTNRIAERARVSIGSLYQYYPNKDSILVELAARHLDTGRADAWRRANEELPGSIEDSVRVQVRQVIENHRDDPLLLRVMFEETPRSPQLLEKVAEHHREVVGHVRELIERHPDIDVENTYVAARLVVSTVELAIHHLVAEPDPVDTTALEDEVVAMITRYLTNGPAGTA
ncbi:TetR/AcrR family transcriptional regulator [Streptomyces sp. NPDC059785]|uniref:TetR/AcrR family transcriptional regulator n=1 Tax=unclassified Streptomyces TaxID=2593676 RepID=UPI00365FB9F6